MGLLRSKKSFAMEIATKPLVMPSEIAGLEEYLGRWLGEHCFGILAVSFL